MRYYIVVVFILSLISVGMNGINSWSESLCVFGIGVVFWGAMLCPLLVKTADN